MDELGFSEKTAVSIEAEWERVRQLLARPEETAWGAAVIEAHKIFVQVLSEVSFGDSFDERLENANSLFRSPAQVLAAHKVFEHLTIKPGHRIKRSDVSKATDDLLKGVLDMVGRDFVEKDWVTRWLTGLNYFWGNHPRFLVGFLTALLGFVAVVWFLADTVPGRWLAGIAIGFAQFVVGWPSLLVSLIVVWLLALGLGYWLFERRPK